MHTSTTESILQWPHFADYPSLRDLYFPTFDLEQSRTPLPMNPSTMGVYVGVKVKEEISESFEHTVNFWYPIVSQATLANTHALLLGSDDSTSSCLAYLIMALGCAGQACSGIVGGNPASSEDVEFRKEKTMLASMYMDRFLKRIYLVHMEMSTVSVQCLFLTAQVITLLIF